MKCERHNIDLQYDGGYGGDICPKCDEENRQGCQGCFVIMVLLIVLAFCFQEQISNFILWLSNLRAIL